MDLYYYYDHLHVLTALQFSKILVYVTGTVISKTNQREAAIAIFLINHNVAINWKKEYTFLSPYHIFINRPMTDNYIFLP